MLILIILLILNIAFILPSSGIWAIYPKNKNNIPNALIDYKAPLEPKNISVTYPSLKANNYLLLDVDTNKIIFSKNHNDIIYPASTTKLATALTALNIYPLEEIITVKEAYKEGKVMDLVPGEKITVRSLVTALLVYSANDSAISLANHHPDGFGGFINQMNLLVKKYNLKNTHFTNVDGIHNDNHYSTVYDLSQLARLAIKNKIVSETVKQKNIIVTDVDHLYSHSLVSTNELLGKLPEVEGLKTGWTPEAGGCFISLININGRYLISVVAQSLDRFKDTELIIDWSKKNIIW
jgi:D-alanyl-D-alanine carboxypeptidase